MSAQTGNPIFDFYTTYFEWLLNLTNCNYIFSTTLEGPSNENPFLVMLKCLIMMPFILFAFSIPLIWMLRIVIWAFSVCFDDIR